jgi:tRNA (cytidine/uridine-2'-O-)-methyltransferase
VPAAPRGGRMTTCPTQPGRTCDLESIYWHPCRESASPLSAHLVRRTKTARRCVFSSTFSTRAEGRCPMRVVLFQPDIPQNTGTILRLCACLSRGGPYHRAGRLSGLRPPFSPLRNGLPRPGHHRAARVLDRFRGLARPNRRTGWFFFRQRRQRPISIISIRNDDLLLFGRESAGVPDDVVNAADERLVIPIAAGMRSLNVAMSGRHGAR